MTAATATMPAIEPETTETANIFDKAVCLSLNLCRFGVRRKVKVEKLKPGAKFDAGTVNASKAILDAPELDAIKRADGELRRRLEARTSGPALFRDGVYMLSYLMVPEVDKDLQERLRERAEVLVPAFLAVYSKAKETAREALGDLFDETEYPDVAEVEAAFTASIRYFKMGAADKLSSIDADIFEREQEKAAAGWAEVLQASRDVMTAELQGLVDHLVERLEPAGPGMKAKRFNSTLVENLDEFLRTFNLRDIADSRDLKAVVERAREALRGVTPEALRNSRVTRQQTAEKFAQIKQSIDTLAAAAPARRYTFDE